MAGINEGFEYLNLDNIPTKAHSRDNPLQERPTIGEIEKCDISFTDAFRIPVPGETFDYKGTVIHLYEKQGKTFAYSASKELPKELLDVNFVIFSSEVTPVITTYLLFGAGHVGFAVKDAPNMSTIQARSTSRFQEYDYNNQECSTELVEFKVKIFELDDGGKVNIATVDDYSPSSFEVREAMRLQHL